MKKQYLSNIGISPEAFPKTIEMQRSEYKEYWLATMDNVKPPSRLIKRIFKL